MFSNQILFFGAPKSGKLSIINDLFGSLPTDIPEDTHSGIIHSAKIKTQYYQIDVGIWIDETQERVNTHQASSVEFQKWCLEFKSEEVMEVRKCLSGLVFCFDLNDSLEYIESCSNGINNVIDFMKDECFSEYDEVYQWGGITLAVGFKREGELMVANEKLLEIEDYFIENGIEFINFNESGVNEYKDKIGKDRFKEILETNDWKDMEKTRKTSEDKDGKKIEKSDSDDMQRGLLNNEKLEVEDILNKLKIAKLETSKLPDSEKKQYAENIINEMIKYI